MKAIPVSSSILAAQGIASFVQAQYALGGTTTSRLLKAGINHTYRIDSEEKIFVFRVYSHNWRTREEVLEELNLLLHLHQNGIAVSYPIRDGAMNFLQEIAAPEGMRLGVLFSYAPGHKIQNYSPENHFEIGKMMANMHRLTEGMELRRTTYSPDVLLHSSLASIQQFLPKASEEMQFLIATRPILEKAILDADPQKIRVGVVHLDIWFDNLNISEDGAITLFDFDFCGNGWLCLDIAYYILQLHNTEKDAIERAAKMKAFYKGYESILKISADEKRLLPALGVSLYYFYLGVQCQRFDNWSNTFLNETYLKRFVTVMIRGYYEACPPVA
jgi:Ser/Thr protein kinase RdoA (MazF antagonist)